MEPVSHTVKLGLKTSIYGRFGVVAIELVIKAWSNERKSRSIHLKTQISSIITQFSLET